MRAWQAAFEVARWEFQRYVKPKQQVIGIIMTMVIAGGAMSMGRAAARDGSASRDIAVIGSEHLPIAALAPPSYTFTQHAPQEEGALRDSVAERKLDALLIVRSTDHAELVLRRSAVWTGELQALLRASRQQVMTERAGLSGPALESILAAPVLEVGYARRTDRERRGEIIALLVIVGLMLMAIFIGMSYIFTSITGEKQQRVTEQIVSAIPAQSWVDGKILGLMAVSLVGVLGQGLAFLGVFWLVRRFTGGLPIALPDSLGHPGVLMLLLLFGVLGMLFWFAFLGGVAAMIDDPNSSTRSPMLFIPVLASGIAFSMLGNPDSPMGVFLSLFPATSPSAMPVRIVAGNAAAWEVLLSLALLVGGLLVLRLAAGRVFRVAMLMYGKEPSWGEVRRWAMGGE